MPRLLPIDRDYMADLLLRLLEMPSPTGRTDEIMRLLGEEVEALGLPTRLTRRGVLHATLGGARADLKRVVVVHADTIGAMVKAIKPNGRLQVVAVGTWSARFAEGARVQVFTDEPGVSYTGTMLPLKASGHAFNEEVDSQITSWQNIEVRIDERVEDADAVRALGIRVGDFVAVDAQPVITPSGFVCSRHLDDKAGVAAALAGFKAVIEAGVEVPVSASFVCTIAEEVGLGATNLGADVAEALSIDAAVVAPGQHSREDTVNVAMHDMSGPFDYHLTRRMTAMCNHLGIPHTRDLFTYYRSDIAAALEAGAEMRAALIGFGTDATHGWERTHLDGLERIAQLVAGYLQVPFIFAFDVEPEGKVESFPEQEQRVGLVVDPS
ncbi:osmoprotectant NAGGN system M42 family peptidase [Euzebya sp.]|uniref:osmoprotectant NAGGN system M42 family peptidase n=1 Tax=Euzebya sp. TaxID=1971409 RepID=UPI003512D2B9